MRVTPAADVHPFSLVEKDKQKSYTSGKAGGLKYANRSKRITCYGLEPPEGGELSTKSKNNQDLKKVKVLVW